MAGSAALVVIAAAAFGSFATALTYVLVFGLGTIAGMALLSASIALPMSWSSRMMNPLHTVLQLTIGATTSSLGLFIVYNNISYLAA